MFHLNGFTVTIYADSVVVSQGTLKLYFNTLEEALDMLESVQ
jgi:hypothetical protein